MRSGERATAAGGHGAIQRNAAREPDYAAML